MKNLKITLRAKDFKDTKFCSNGNCAIAKAARRVFTVPNRDIAEGVNELTVDRVDYAHDSYDYATFDQDQLVAHSLDYNNTVIRTIYLREVL